VGSRAAGISTVIAELLRDIWWVSSAGSAPVVKLLDSVDSFRRWVDWSSLITRYVSNTGLGCITSFFVGETAGSPALLSRRMAEREFDISFVLAEASSIHDV